MSPSKAEDLFKDPEGTQRVQALTQRLGDVPEKWQHRRRNCRPLMLLLVAIIEWLCEVGAALYHLVPVNCLWVLYGVAVCFFGGQHADALAALAAFHAVGGDQTSLAVRSLGEQAFLALDSDPGFQAGDRTTGFRGETKRQRLERRALMVLSALEPADVAMALAGLSQGCAGFLVTIRWSQLRTVALGAAIASYARKLIAIAVAPALCHLVPDDARRWVGPMINWLAMALCVTGAFWVPDIAVVMSAVAGGLTVSRKLLLAAQVYARRALAEDAEAGMLLSRLAAVDPAITLGDECLGWALAAAGAYTQLKHAPVLIFPLSLLLGPLDATQILIQKADARS